MKPVTTLTIALITLMLVACQRAPMALPGMFATGIVDPLADVPATQATDLQWLFYATDRVYDGEKTNWNQYTRLRSDGLDLGRIQVTFGGNGNWQTMAAAARGEPDAKRHSPQIIAVTKLGEMDRPAINTPNQPPDASPTGPTYTPFIAALNEQLLQSPGKAITVFIHGFKTDFQQAALAAAEYDFYTGGLGPFILYSWPSYNDLFEYSHDRDSVRYTSAHARKFIELLADQINAGKLDAQKIHIVAHSSGAEIIGSVLSELALLSRDSSPEERRKLWRIGSVLMIAPDISTDVARERLLKQDLAGMFDKLVVYSSTNDRALRWASSVLYRTPRIGAIREQDLTDSDRYYLDRAPNVALVDVDSSPYGGFVNHSHHRFSPTVASDVILCLRSQLKPAERGLIRDEGQYLWYFPDDYHHRVTDAAKRVYQSPGKP